MTDNIPVPPPPDQLAAAAALCDAATPALRAATDALGWHPPERQTTRDGAARCFFATGLHKHARGLALLSVRVVSETKPTLDLRVTGEFADVDVFNAERIVRCESVADAEVLDWLETQLDRAVAALQRRIAAR